MVSTKHTGCKRGNTFYGIARRHGVSLSHVWQANGMSESTILREGTVLTIPAKGMMPPPQKGDDGIIGFCFSRS